MIVLYDLGLIAVILILQTTLAEFAADLTGAKPDMFLLLVSSIGLLRGRYAGIGYGWFLGLLQDILYGNLLGQNALSKGLLGYLAGFLHRKTLNLTIFHMLIALLATLFDTIFHLGILFLLYGKPFGKQALITIGIIVLMNTIISPLVSWLVNIFTRKIPEY